MIEFRIGFFYFYLCRWIFISFINFLCGGEVRKKLQKAVIKNYIIEKKIETILWNFMTFSSSVRVVLDVFFFVFYSFQARAMYFVINDCESSKMPFFATLFVLENHSMIRFYRWFHASRDAVKLSSDELLQRENREKENIRFHFYPKAVCWKILFCVSSESGKIRFDEGSSLLVEAGNFNNLMFES